MASGITACHSPVTDELADPAPSLLSPDHLFQDATAGSGLDFVHFNGRSGELYLAEITCGGGGLVDIDNDGDLDLYLSQGHMLGPDKTIDQASEPPAHPLPLSDRLYRNDLIEDEGAVRVRWVDVTVASGIASRTTAYGCGVAAGDVDNDGNNDLVVLTLAENRLLLGRGDGTFTETANGDTATTGFDDVAARSSVGAALADLDRDGWLDLYVANNLTFVYDAPEPCFDLAGAPDYCGPGAFSPQQDLLWHNRGASAEQVPRFTDVTASAGLHGRPGPALGVVAADFDQDGWLDLYVAQDGQPNLLLRNQTGVGSGQGSLRFTESALLAGAAVNSDGAAEASMGVDAADYDRDGDLDLVLAHLVKESNTLYENDGHGQFADRSRTSGLAAPSLSVTAFGAGFVDLDLDGWLDLVTVNGAVTHLPALVRANDPFPLHQPNQIFLSRGGNQGAPRFEDATERGGPAFAHSAVSRAALFGDLDNDGDLDLVVVNNGGPARVLLNQTDGRHAWLGLRLVGTMANGGIRDLLGARASIEEADGRRQMAVARTDGSYNASRDPRIVFGLGPRSEDGGSARAAYTVTVTWPDGAVERFADVPADRYTTLAQGRGASSSPTGAP